MRNLPILHWCRHCSRHTYWINSVCQRCQQIRLAKIRGILIAVIMTVAFAWAVVKRYWGA